MIARSAQNSTLKKATRSRGAASTGRSVGTCSTPDATIACAGEFSQAPGASALGAPGFGLEDALGGNYAPYTSSPSEWRPRLSTVQAAFEAQLAKLIAKFQPDEGYYLSRDYSEAQARIDFITPFFKALGWDVENEAGLPHHQRDVIVERVSTLELGRKITATDAQIEELVYELYGITDEERKIIEGD